MQKLTITAADLDADGVYIGTTDVTNFDGHIEIAADLGRVRFGLSLNAKGGIRALAGSGIEAGEGIEAGSGIEAGEGIKAGWGIEAGSGIKAGEGIKAGSDIEAGSGIKAGWGIKAGSRIEAGEGIKAGLSISAKFITADLRIFAGLCSWRIPNNDEMQIRAVVRRGVVAFGEVVPVVAEDGGA